MNHLHTANYVYTAKDKKSEFAFRLSFKPLFVWGFSTHSRISPSFGDVTVTGERLPTWPMLSTSCY